MNLYRIDTADEHGYGTGCVFDILGPILFRRWAQARSAAILAANNGRTPRYAHITRISGAGACRRMGTVIPGGAKVHRIAPPHGAKLTNP